MRKTRVLRLLLCSAFTVAVLVVAMPDASATVQVVCKTATLPERQVLPPAGSAGDIDTFVVFNFTPLASAILANITYDTYPTFEAGMCTFTAGTPSLAGGTGPSNGDPDECDDTSVTLNELRIGGDNYRPEAATKRRATRSPYARSSAATPLGKTRTA